jgi:hypothetical protein
MAEYANEWEETQKNRFDTLLNYDLRVLLRESSTEFNFLEIKPRVLAVVEQVRTLSEHFEFWAELSDQKRVVVNSALDDMITHFSKMADFDPKQNNAWDQRSSLIVDFTNRYNAFYEGLTSPLDAFLGRAAYSEEIAGKFGQEAKKELAEIRRVKKEIEKVEVDVKEAASVAGNVASTAHSAAFSEQAIEHKNTASRWLKALLVASLVVTGLAVTVLYDIVNELRDSTYQAGAEAYIFKVALLALLYFGMRFLIKNYSAHEHLYITNIHRANVLKSMEAFRDSAIEDGAKDSILLAAVGSAYSLQETGFITTKEGAGSDDGDILNIVNTALKR